MNGELAGEHCCWCIEACDNVRKGCGDCEVVLNILQRCESERSRSLGSGNLSIQSPFPASNIMFQAIQ